MNKFALLSVFLLAFFSLMAQDRIVSIHHDTIDCTIITINNERILYELKNRDGSVTGRLMNLSEVAEYTRTPQPENNSKPRKLKISNLLSIPENLWCLGLNIGRSTMPWYLDNIQSAAMPDYYNKLKTGFHINTSAHYMITGFMGVGAEYSFYNTSFSGSMPSQYSPSIFLMTSETYRQYINYLGPSVLFVQHLGARRKFILSESLSAGAMFIRLESQSTYPNVDYSGYTDITYNSLLTGNSMSAKFGLTAEYRLDHNISVGLGGNFIWGSLKKASFESRGPNNYTSTSENEELPKAMNLSRIDYSFVLRYQF